MQKRLLLLFSLNIVLAATALSQATSLQNLLPDQPVSKYYSTLPATDTHADSLLNSLTNHIKQNQNPIPEKIYVHTDRTGYMQGDTIWFRAYSWCGYEQVADTLSKVLYAELVNEKGRTIISKKLLIDNGLSEGDFSLDTTVIPGRYFIRAYTRWMKNRNTGEAFISPVTVGSIKQNFHIECAPEILRQAGRDTLLLKFRFMELDLNGNLKSSVKHNISYVLKSGSQLIDSGAISSGNTVFQNIKRDLSLLDKRQLMTRFTASVNDGGISYSKSFDIPVSEGLDMQFFPEGGTFVYGLPNRMAFKVIGADGLSREVNGTIESKEGEIVTTFSSYHKGMGSFIISPDRGKAYLAHFVFNDRNYLIPLPAASENGQIMTIRNVNSENPMLLLRSTVSEKNSIRYVTGSTNGNIWFSAMIKNTGDSSRFSIPIKYLPEGICRITLLSADFKPLSERLIYVDKENRFRLDIKTDSLSYGKRSKVSLVVSAIGPDGGPLPANLSVAVVDKELTAGNKRDNGIVSYQLLESELKGTIEDPAYYFENGKCSNYEALDLLMLTQGYREFIRDNSSERKTDYLPETNFNISGRLISDKIIFRSKKNTYSNVSLVVMCFGSTPWLSLARPDSLGRFSLDIPLLYGQPHSLIQATNYRSKKFAGEIRIDEVIEQPVFPFNDLWGTEKTRPVIENVALMQTAIKTTLFKDPSYGYMTRDLPEVVVKAKAKNWYLDYKKEAIKTVNLDSLDPTGNKFESLTDLLIREFGATMRMIPRTGMKVALLPCVSVMGPNEWFPIYVVNDNTWFNGNAHSYDEFLASLSMVSNIPVNEIKKLSVLKPGGISAHYADPIIAMEIRQSAVVVELYDKGFRGDPPGIKSFILEGLDAPRKFYSPKYDNPLQNSSRFDARTTLFWEPELKTDSAGQARVEFYTGDRKAGFEVIVNGIVPGLGSPGYGRLVVGEGKR